MRSLFTTLENNNVLVSDGAWGTLLHQRGLQPGECPELWNITYRENVSAIAKNFVDPGADIILTNSFDGSPVKLAHYGLKDRTTELNEAVAAISREAAGEDHFVLGSICPTGVMLMMGEVSEQALYEGFCVQAESLKKGDIDAIRIEIMSAIDEASLAIRAAKESTDLEVACTFTFEKIANGKYRTIIGVSPAEMVQTLKEAGADIIGTDCGNGFNQMIEIVQEIRKVESTTPVLVHANAGKPTFQDGKTIFSETPEMMTADVHALIPSGANIIDGCCGTTPQHIHALTVRVRNKR